MRWLPLVIVVGLVACGGGSSEESSPDAILVAEDLRFDTEEIRVEAGSDVTIEVENRDPSTLHNFHVVDAPGEPATRLAEGPDTQRITFRIDEPGTYTFICDTHPGMTGTVVVE